MSDTVVVGMSGGVDSSVAALLLKQQGYRVLGLFMRNWSEPDEDGVCRASEDFREVARTCAHLGIAFHAVDYVEEYRQRVFSGFLEDLRRGITPNPDSLCNQVIKFGCFFEQALAQGAKLVATGHYCRIEGDRAGWPHLLRGVDPDKDQSYFLYRVSGRALTRVLFPVGSLRKTEVRQLARRAGLPNHDRKGTTGLCYIGARNFRRFLERFVPPEPGELRNLDGELVGEHQGVCFYTVGQRHGLRLGGNGEPWYVVAKDAASNRVLVARGRRHPALYADELVARDPSWIAGHAPALPLRCSAKIRYRQPDQPCTVIELEPGTPERRPEAVRLRVVFDRPQRAITPGQDVVFYQGEQCLGGAVIERAGPSYHEQGRPVPDP